MTDFSGRPFGSGQNLATEDNSAADTGSECYHDDTVKAASAALPHFSKSCDIGIVSDTDIGYACQIKQFFFDIKDRPMNIGTF